MKNHKNTMLLGLIFALVALILSLTSCDKCKDNTCNEWGCEKGECVCEEDDCGCTGIETGPNCTENRLAEFDRENGYFEGIGFFASDTGQVKVTRIHCSFKSRNPGIIPTLGGDSIGGSSASCYEYEDAYACKVRALEPGVSETIFIIGDSISFYDQGAESGDLIQFRGVFRTN